MFIIILLVVKNLTLSITWFHKGKNLLSCSIMFSVLFLGMDTTTILYEQLESFLRLALMWFRMIFNFIFYKLIKSDLILLLSFYPNNLRNDESSLIRLNYMLSFIFLLYLMRKLVLSWSVAFHGCDCWNLINSITSGFLSARYLEIWRCNNGLEHCNVFT